LHPAMDESGAHWGATIADKITVRIPQWEQFTSNLEYSVANVNLNTDGTATITFRQVSAGVII